MWPTKHFTADDLDAFHTEALSNEMRLHLETCEQCRRLVVEDRAVLAQLATLGDYGPRADFADRVMARVAIDGPAAVPVLSYPRFTARRAAIMGTLAAGLVASVAWSAANRVLLDGWLRRIGSALTSTGWAWLRGIGAALNEQPWFGTVSQLWESPARLVATIVVFLGSYLLGVMILRRLITPSVEAVSGANA
jgi:hypothetical protein